MKMIFLNLLILICSINYTKTFENNNNDEFCYKKSDCENDLHLFGTNELNGMKYLIYDVSKDASYSLRLNIYLRMARIVHNLGINWTLVLPPWRIKEWNQDNNETKNQIYWYEFFKVEVFQELLPVIEFNEFIEHISNELDLVLILNRFYDSFDQTTSQLIQTNSNRYEIIDENCKHIQFYEKNGHINGFFFGFKDYLKAKKMICIKVDGNVKIIEDVLNNELKDVSTIFIQNVDLFNDDLEKDENKDEIYWLFRRSIQFTDKIITRANKFRRNYFDSDDEKDKTFISNDLTLDNKLNKLNRQKQSDTVGGNYVAVHLEINKNDQFDNLNITEQLTNEQIIKQILIALKDTDLNKVFIKIDKDEQWTDLELEFKKQLNLEFKSVDKYKLLRYKNKSNKLNALELELIQQWILSHGKLFIGTSNSMFSRLVQEQREILGFKPSTTLNVF